MLPFDIEAVDRKIYSRLKDIEFHTQVLFYEDLETELEKVLNSEESISHTFDVTAVLKSYLVDIYTILRFRNISAIYTFELFSQRFYDYRDLIHNHTYRKTYDFVCLAKSQHTASKITVSEDVIIAKSDFNRMKDDLEIGNKRYEQLKNKLANDFATLVSIIYFLLLTPIFGWLCWSVSQPEGWNKVEPLTYILALGWLISGYVIQGLSRGQFPSLNPKELFSALKEWRKSKLE